MMNRISDLEKVEASLRLFDCYFDVRQNYAQVAPLLAAVPPPRDPATGDLRWLLAYVGATWARIVIAGDLEFRLEEGRTLFEESQPSASAAERRLKSSAAPPAGLDVELGWQILARWNDAAAKLHYRCGEHFRAGVLWKRSLDIIRDHPFLLFLHPDIRSSQLRNQEESDRMDRGDHAERNLRTQQEQFRRDIATTLERLRSRSPEVAEAIELENSPKLARLLDGLSPRQLEELRGLANLYQNSDQYSKVRCISEATGDRLRQMQSFHAEARVVARTDPLKAARLWKLVRDGRSWVRGVFFARQNLALLDADLTDRLALAELARGIRQLLRLSSDDSDFQREAARLRAEAEAKRLSQEDAASWKVLRPLLDMQNDGFATATSVEDLRQALGAWNHSPEPVLAEIRHEVEKLARAANPVTLIMCVEELFALIDDIQDHDRSGPTDTVGINDVELHGWTVRAAAKYFDRLHALPGKQPEHAEKCRTLEDRLHEELEQMVRGHRTVLRASTQKYTYAKHFGWAYRRLFERQIARSGRDEVRDIAMGRALAWVEEASCRDLLDVLAAQRAKTTRASDPLPTAAARSTVILATSPALADASHRAFRRNSREAEPEGIREHYRRSLEAFDKHSELNAVPTADISPDVFGRVRAFARDHQVAVVRFTEDRRDEPHPDAERFGAFCFSPDGGCRYVRLGQGGNLVATWPAMKALKSADDRESDLNPSLAALATSIGAEILGPSLPTELDRKTPVVLIPTGGLWEVPLHVGLVGDEPLAVRNPTILCGSVEALMSRYANLSRQLPTSESAPTGQRPPEIGIISSLDKPIRDSVVFGLQPALWAQDHGFPIAVAGPAQVDHPAESAEDLHVQVRGVIERDPEILYVGCHGGYFADDNGAHTPFLKLTSAEGRVRTFLTPYDLATLPPMRRNHVTVLAACVSGQGAARSGGEVGGFYRALAAAGASVCLMSLWSIRSGAVDGLFEQIVGHLARRGVSLLEAYRCATRQLYEDADGLNSGERTAQSCCLALYL